jgi:hypothetical protein
MGIHTPQRKLESHAPRGRASGEADLWVIARRALAAAQRVIGIVPAPVAASSLQVARALAEALASLTAGSIAIVDADGSDVGGATRDAAEPLVLARWLAPRIALVGPDAPPAVGHAAATLARLVRYTRARAGATVVDLSGLEQHGELAGAFASCDSVLLVAQAGRTRERELLAAADLIGEPLLLGVLLTR